MTLSVILEQYVRSLIVNLEGDPYGRGRDYDSWEEVLERFHDDNEANDFDEQYDIPESWQVDDGEPITGESNDD